jgi:hypothetical protein
MEAIMANQWFRMYSEFANDPKVQMMSEVDQRRLVMLFCFRCNGDVTLQDEEVTFQLRISNEEWGRTKALFIQKGFIDSGNNIINWDKRQFISDSSAARVARHRDKKKHGCNVTVTPPEQNRTDTEHNRTDITPSANPESEKTKKKTVKTSIPGNFSISDAIRSWYEKQGYKENIDAHLVAFIDKAIAKNYTYADWDAAFRTAIRDDWAKLRVNGQQKPAYNGQSRDWSDDYWRGYKVIG